MRLEIIDRGIELNSKQKTSITQTLEVALDQYEHRLRLIRVRVVPAGHHGKVRCKLRAWCGPGPTVVVSTLRETLSEAVDEAAADLQRALRRRRGRVVALRRRQPRQESMSHPLPTTGERL